MTITIVFFSIKGLCQSDTIMLSLNATGNNTSSDSGTVSYSIGQVFYSYIDGQVAEGIQHGTIAEIEDYTNNEDSDVPDDIAQPNAKALVYPNPTSNYITLTTEGFNFTNQLNSYQLYNYQGKLILQNVLQNQNSRIDLSNFSSSIYILQIFAEEKLLKTFKIVKQ